MTPTLLAIPSILLMLYGLVKLLNLSSLSERPQLLYKNIQTPFVKYILQACPILHEIYTPTLLWGKSGHIQTFVYSLYQGYGSNWLSAPTGDRQAMTLDDGSTVTFDVFEANMLSMHEDYTLAVCPGFGNTSDDLYLRTFAGCAQNTGYRTAILNHVGSLQNIELTAPRVFTYGGTSDYHKMICELKFRYPNTKMIAVGFSMGANIVVKYLGEKKDNEKQFVGAISVCQGYDINRAAEILLDWKHMRRAYVYIMTMRQKALLRRHYNNLIEALTKKTRALINTEKLFNATSLVELDEAFTRHALGYSSVQEFYESHSSKNYIHKITIPLIIINAADDPIVPEELRETPRKYAGVADNCIYVVTKHGGHLGFFSNGYLIPDTMTWMNKALLQFTAAVTKFSESSQTVSCI